LNQNLRVKFLQKQINQN